MTILSAAKLLITLGCLTHPEKEPSSTTMNLGGDWCAVLGDGSLSCEKTVAEKMLAEASRKVNEAKALMEEAKAYKKCADAEADLRKLVKLEEKP